MSVTFMNRKPCENCKDDNLMPNGSWRERGVIQEPFTTCSVCDQEGRWKEEAALRKRAKTILAIGYDHYGAHVMAYDPEQNEIFLVRNGEKFYRAMASALQSREDVVSDAMTLRKENAELLVENAKLRRKLEHK